MLRFAGLSLSPRPLVTRGTAAPRPPLPELTATPTPVFLNHVSNVNCVAPSPPAPVPADGPNVTYWLEPLNCNALSGAAARAAPPNTSYTPAHRTSNPKCLAAAPIVPPACR